MSPECEIFTVHFLFCVFINCIANSKEHWHICFQVCQDLFKMVFLINVLGQGWAQLFSLKGHIGF